MSLIRKQGSMFYLNGNIPAFKIAPQQWFIDLDVDTGTSEPGSPEPDPGGGSGGGDGSLVFPWPKSAISSPYGWRTHPIWGDGRFHEGIDFALACGYPLKPVGAGVISRRGWYYGWGESITVDHGNGISSQYNHMSGYNASVGQQVTRDTVIGYVGTTGDSTGCHLDFNLLVAGYTNPKGSPRADPEKYVKWP